MKRRQQSGASHRKQAEAKRARDQELLQRIPKLSHFFGESSWSTSSVSQTSEILLESNETESSQSIGVESNQFDLEATESRQSIETGSSQFDLEPTESIQSIESESNPFNSDPTELVSELDCEFSQSSQSQTLFETDAALWDIDCNLSALQSFWTKEGETFIYHFYSFLIHNACFHW